MLPEARLVLKRLGHRNRLFVPRRNEFHQSAGPVLSHSIPQYRGGAPPTSPRAGQHGRVSRRANATMAEAASQTATRRDWGISAGLLKELRDAWFQHLDGDERFILPQQEDYKQWFMGGPQFDAFCTKQFGSQLAAIRSSGATVEDILQGVQPSTPLDWLSLVLLLDQMTRNCYRGDESSVVFNFFDPLAQGIARRAIEDGIPRSPGLKHRVSYRLWFYLPLMHSEDIAMHDLAVKCYHEMADDFETLLSQDEEPAEDNDVKSCWKVLAAEKERTRKLLAQDLSFETRHRDVIARFGRYPHRNKAVGRETTAEEKEYLENGGETFSAAS